MVFPCTEPDRNRSAYIENSQDGGTDRRVNDQIAHTLLQDIIDEITGANKEPLFLDYQDITIPGTSQDAITYVVPIGKTVSLKSIRVTCRQCVTYKIFIDSDVVGSGRIGSGIINDDFIFNIERIAQASSTIKVVILANSGRPASDVECYLQGTTNN